MNSAPTPGEILVSEVAPGYLSGTIDPIPFTVSGSAAPGRCSAGAVSHRDQQPRERVAPGAFSRSETV